MSPRKCLPFRVAPCALLFVVACSSPPDIPATGNGALHQGTFVYTCASSADASCGAASLPAGIAVGADFELRYDPSTPGEHALEPSTSFFSVDPDGPDTPDARLHTMRAGYGVVLVTNPKGEVIDFLNLHMKTIASLTVLGIDPAAVLKAGETRTIHAAAFDTAGEPLAGTLMLEWESADGAIASVTMTDTDRSLGTATLQAVKAGTTKIRVVAGASTGSIAVNVGGT